MIYMQGCKGLLQTGPLATSKGPYIIYKQGPHTGMQGDPNDKSSSRRGPLQTKRHYIKGVLKYKGPLQTGGTIDKGPLQTKGPHRQGVHTDKGPLQQKTPIVTLQTLCNSYRKGAPTNKEPLHDIQARDHYCQRAPYKQGNIT